ncbi:MAG: flagellar biosynthesis anti-sigma factor FlgM [SAR324 cluster bacterium]|uniref:Negative regulator of flagellin synthesis n=1 Tax=SAR324 cluster bacterium TaxID=2024889 RepID=A0A2A4T8V9_9DELT|nr:MAG: flagellar biosynthesis anti-sigma factor FlgM [SAR324 cluster bacterium]
MKINGQYPKLPIQEKNIGKGQEKDVEKQTGIASKRSVAVGKTGSDFTTNRIRNKIDAEPDVNMERVKALKARIKSGEFQIDNIKLANNILKNSILEDV